MGQADEFPLQRTSTPKPLPPIPTLGSPLMTLSPPPTPAPLRPFLALSISDTATDHQSPLNKTSWIDLIMAPCREEGLDHLLKTESDKKVEQPLMDATWSRRVKPDADTVVDVASFHRVVSPEEEEGDGTSRPANPLQKSWESVARPLHAPDKAIPPEDQEESEDKKDYVFV